MTKYDRRTLLTNPTLPTGLLPLSHRLRPSVIVLEVWLAILAMCFAPVLQAETRLSGYLKSYLVLQDELRITDLVALESRQQLQNGTRLMFDHTDEDISFELHYELSPVLSSTAASSQVATLPVQRNAYRLTDPDRILIAESGLTVFGNLDRANVKWRRNWGDLTVGRQPITFGAARIINPTDVFLPFNQQALNTEYRVGVDAIRLQRPLGMLSELDMGLILGPDADPDQSAAYVQLLVNVAGHDLSMTTAQFSDHKLLGVGTQTAVGQLGVWFEFAVVSGVDSYHRLSTGFDYAFNENWFLMVEAHYNSSGAESPDQYPLVRGSAPFQRGEVHLSGRRYLIPVLSWQMSPLATMSAQSIINLSDQSVFTTLTASRNVTQNTHMDIGLQWFTGDRSTFTPPFDFRTGSEFGDRPTVLFGSVRWYF